MTIIKKSNLFDRRSRYFYLFLQNLKLKKNKNLFNRNLIKNYYFYNFFIKTLKKNKVDFLLRSLFYLNNNKILINPLFLFKRKLFNTQYQYNEFLKKNELKSLFVIKKSKNNLNNNFGLNYYLIQNKSITNKFIESLNSDECKDIIKLKFFEHNIIPYYNIHHYNIFIFNLLEIYKLLILLNCFKIN